MSAPEPSWIDHLEACAGWRRGLVLDVRPDAAFRAGHLPGAASHPLEPVLPDDPADLAEALPSIFLPPRHEPLLVVAGDQATADRLAGHLRDRGRAEVRGLALPVAVWAALPGSLRATGPSRVRLWSPPPWLASHEAMLPPPALGPVLDLACGSGRAVVWLAERGYRAVGIDHQPEALALGRRLAATVGATCRFAAADLRQAGNLPAGPWGLVTVFRFLERPLLARLPGLVAPHGVAMIRTFRDAPGYDGHPQPRHRLQPGELAAAFPAGQWEILALEDGFDPDGLPAAGIVVRRRGPGRG